MVGRAEIEVQVEELRDRMAQGTPPVLLDVRRPDEHAICALEGAVLIPLDELASRLDELEKHADIVVYCHHGVRSLNAAMLLVGHGFPRVKSLAGGIDRWSLRIDPTVPRY
jgi:rhodanese-related sulfurtransferase